MYIRRDCLNQVGLFDVENFGKGYGEENDFCCRAASEGWRNLHVLDTFVHHAGGVSFGASKSAREIAAMETLRRLHPNYEREVHQFIAVDPAQSARRKVDLARIQSSTLPVVLAVLHDRAGGTVRHVEELAQHLQGQALFLVLRPAAGGDLSVQWAGRAEALDLRFNATTGFDLLVTALQELGVAHLHFHHLLGHQPQLLSLPARLEISYDFTAHDYYMFCPQISLTDHTNAYCGEKGLDQCKACLQKSAAPGGLSIEAWRAQHGVFLENARCVFAPSQDAAQRFEKVFPQLSVTVVKHTDMTTVSRTPAVCQRKLSPTDPLKIVVIGAMSMIKGADVLEDVAAFAAKEGASLDFHLLGYAYRSLRTRPDTTLTVHGEFAEADLPRLLNELKPDLVWFPAQWPETYSYTLSAALQCGMPVVTTNLGAFAERLAGRDWSWVHRWDARPQEWVALFSDLRTAHFQTGNAPTHALTAPPSVAEQATPWSYAENYLTGLTPCEGTESKRNTALLQTGSSSGLAAPSRKRHVKQKLLWTLVRLRASPVLRGVARAIPLRWQTRAKTWLRA